MSEEECDLASAKTIAIAHVSTITSAIANANAIANARDCEGVRIMYSRLP